MMSLRKKTTVWLACILAMCLAAFGCVALAADGNVSASDWVTGGGGNFSISGNTMGTGRFSAVSTKPMQMNGAKLTFRMSGKFDGVSTQGDPNGTGSHIRLAIVFSSESEWMSSSFGVGAFLVATAENQAKVRTFYNNKETGETNLIGAGSAPFAFDWTGETDNVVEWKLDNPTGHVLMVFNGTAVDFENNPGEGYSKFSDQWNRIEGKFADGMGFLQFWNETEAPESNMAIEFTAPIVSVTPENLFSGAVGMPAPWDNAGVGAGVNFGYDAESNFSFVPAGDPGVIWSQKKTYNAGDMKMQFKIKREQNAAGAVWIGFTGKNTPAIWIDGKPIFHVEINIDAEGGAIVRIGSMKGADASIVYVDAVSVNVNTDGTGLNTLEMKNEQGAVNVYLNGVKLKSDAVKDVVAEFEGKKGYLLLGASHSTFSIESITEKPLLDRDSWEISDKTDLTANYDSTINILSVDPDGAFNALYKGDRIDLEKASVKFNVKKETLDTTNAFRVLFAARDDALFDDVTNTALGIRATYVSTDAETGLVTTKLDVIQVAGGVENQLATVQTSRFRWNSSNELAVVRKNGIWSVLLNGSTLTLDNDFTAAADALEEKFEQGCGYIAFANDGGNLTVVYEGYSLFVKGDVQSDWVAGAVGSPNFGVLDEDERFSLFSAGGGVTAIYTKKAVPIDGFFMDFSLSKSKYAAGDSIYLILADSTNWYSTGKGIAFQLDYIFEQDEDRASVRILYNDAKNGENNIVMPAVTSVKMNWGPNALNRISVETDGETAVLKLNGNVIPVADGTTDPQYEGNPEKIGKLLASMNNRAYVQVWLANSACEQLFTLKSMTVCGADVPAGMKNFDAQVGTEFSLDLKEFVKAADGTTITGYSASVGSVSAGVWTWTPDRAEKTVVTFTVTDSTGTDVSFRISVDVAPKTYAITAGEGITVADRAAVGSTVTFTVTEKDGFDAAVTVKCGEQTIDVSENSFVMPDGDVEITVSYTARKKGCGGTVDAGTFLGFGLMIVGAVFLTLRTKRRSK